MSLLSPLYDASFAAVSFQEQSSSGWLPGRTFDTHGTQYSNEGNHTYIVSGEKAEPFEITAGVDGTQATALLGKRGDTGTLVWSRGSMSATLLDVIPSKAGPLDAYTVRLRFFSTATPTAPGDTNTYLVSDSGAFILDDSGNFITV